GPARRLLHRPLRRGRRRRAVPVAAVGARRPAAPAVDDGVPRRADRIRRRAGADGRRVASLRRADGQERPRVRGRRAGPATGVRLDRRNGRGLGRGGDGRAVRGDGRAARPRRACGTGRRMKAGIDRLDPARHPWAVRAVALLWGFAEATLFFVIPDVWIGFVALHGLRQGLAAAAWTLPGALAGGAAVYLASHENQMAVLAVFDRLPAIGDALVLRALGHLEQHGWLGLLLG